MFTLRPAAPAATPEYIKRNVNVIAPSLEGYVGELASRFPQLNFGLSPALETQQLDASEKQAAIDQIQSTIDEYAKNHPATGAMNVYLLDGKGVAGMDEQNEGPLRAVVAQVLNDPSHTVAALLPEDASVSKVEDLSPASMLRALAETVLTADGVTILVGKHATESFLEGLNAGKFSASSESTDDTLLAGDLQPSTEGLAGLALVGLISAFGYALWKGGKRVRAKNERRANLPNDLREAMQSTYLSASWRAQQEYVQGDVSANGIAKHLMTERGMPANIITAVDQTVSAVNQLTTHHLHNVKAYVHQLEEVFQASNRGTLALGVVGAMGSFGAHLKENLAGDGAVRKATINKVAALRKPFEQAHFPSTALLGNIRFIHGDFRRATSHGRLPERLPAIAPADIEGAARGVLALVEAVIDLRVLYDQVGELSLHLPEVPPQLTKPKVRAPSGELVEDEDEDLLDEVTYDRAFRQEYAYPLHTLADQLLDSAEALARWLERSVVHRTASTEGLGGEIALTVGVSLALGAVVAGIGKLIKAGFNKLVGGKAGSAGTGAPTSSAKDATVELRKLLQKTYLDPAWLAKQHPVEGPVDGKGIADALAKGNGVPKDIATAVHEHLATIEQFYHHWKGPYSQYVATVNRVAEEIAKITNVDEAVDYAEKKLVKLKGPDSFFPDKFPGLLGNPVVTKDGETSIDFEGLKNLPGKEPSLPALTPEQAPKVAQALLDVLDASVKIQVQFDALPSPYDYEGNLPFSDDVWQTMIGTGADDHYCHNWHHHMYEYAIWEIEDSLKYVAEALKTWLARSFK